jgi:hypothetical protein
MPDLCNIKQAHKMDTFLFSIISGAGVLFVVAFSLASTFYTEIRKQVRAARYRKNAARKVTRQGTQGSRLRIPGYYEKITKRSQREDLAYETRPTII